MSRTQMNLNDAFWFQEGPGVRKWQFRNEGIKLLNVGNIEKVGRLNLAKTERCLSVEEATSKYAHFLVDEGDLVIASSGISIDADGFLRTRGSFVEARDLPLCLNTSTIRFKPLDGKSDLNFLRHWLQSREFRIQITKLVTGSAQLNFGPSHLMAIKINLPSLEEQRRIAAILDQAEELRAKRRAALALLDQLPQAIFLEMFGDPITNPKRLETALLGDLCTRITDGTHQPPKFSDSGHPFLFVRNIISGEIDFDTEKFISDETYEELTRRCPIEQGDVIYSTVGSYGVPVVVRTRKKFAFQRHIAHLKPNRDKLLPEFLSGMLASPPVRRQADGFARGVAQKTINLADIRRYLVFAPSIEMQQHFADRVKAIHRAKAAHQSALTELSLLFLSLQSQTLCDSAPR